MPPKRCPECGRFLANEVVASLDTASAPCPRCGAQLTPDVVVGGTAAQHATSPAADADSADRSVRPPDLDPSDVQRRDLDVLSGWDVGATPEEVASWRSDRRPFPTDTVVVLGAGLAGAALAGLVAREHRAGWAAAGVIGGVGLAGAWRRIWELRL